MPVTAVAAIALALALDLAVAEFPERIHPVAFFGRAIGLADREWGRPRAVGAVVALVLPLAAGTVATGVTAIVVLVSPLAATVVAGAVLFSAISLRMLLSVAREVIAGSEDALPDARERLRALAGRDASGLGPGEVRSAAVESAAENLADGFVAPLLAFALAAHWSLPAAAGAAAWVKAVDTADSMLGYPDRPVGRASARLDDAVMWLPARASAVLIAVAARDPGALARAGREARKPPSPNSGWPMATLAAALGVRFEKPGAYVLFPDAPLPTPERARRGVRVVAGAGALAALGAGVIAWP